MLNWTVYGLPACFLVGSAGEETRSFWVEDPAEAGAPRRRARFSRSLRSWPSITTGRVKNDVADQIIEFYDVYTGKGVKAFLFPVPRRRGDTEMAYVRFSSMPQIVPINSLFYNVTFGLEEV